MKILALLAQLIFVAAGLTLTVFLGYVTVWLWLFFQDFPFKAPTLWAWLTFYQGLLMFGFGTLLSATLYGGIIIWYIRRKKARPDKAAAS